MNNSLPPGWRVINNTGTWSAPAAPPDSGSDSEDDIGLTDEDLRPDSPGWEDVEEEVEVASIKCLICDEKLDGARKMVVHCMESHSLDLDRIRKEHRLDFLATIQLVNYIRFQVRSNNAISTDHLISNPEAFRQDRFMQPVLEDDALLYSIDELGNPNDPEDPLAQKSEDGDVEGGAEGVGESAGHRMVVERALR
ncbi:hypothetical protein LTR91_005602 [Friedmanniomyces endolithicus]|uniref:type I protein arginine methyltransferase n=1 Tax=Friedmanniomyces endolithicus TaxID=329885 RepID=A0AAN6KTK2_9PEZI|nr:hypothetical protein LTR94_010023 [Friedmanniomyces endolithicus]KAK0792098.1 hypothetical protein LTR75_011587 [Friedmanniomyces endolithicus]KAK0794133.1 hypothetical protein LTR38_009329 [Friedmanniomyces endolithicus]KAK0809001.1 hypothetical protein LTR59_002705 [Friedmanniomyces endolithicus]KAK0850247.1 hypothetical protein LTR03_004709 [Friedmanniomyces endolithicus]